MKKTLLFFAALFITLTVSSQRAEAAGIPILYGNGPEFEQLYELPDSVVTDEGAHVNFGLGFEQFSLFYIPIWNYGTVEYALYDEANSTIYSLDEEDVAYFTEEYGLELAEKPELSFWNRIGGKLIVLAVIVVAFLVWGWRHKDDEEETTEAAKTAPAETEEVK